MSEPKMTAEERLTHAHITAITLEVALAAMEAHAAAAVEEANKRIKELEGALHQTATDMGAEGCLAGRCFPQDPEDPPCPWLPVAAVLNHKETK